ncbi:hypothetical protein Btru_049208 [Bulinus truncatus]|nr:hypothetical protein Btru_049208 [Bulinus truncatus]
MERQGSKRFGRYRNIMQSLRRRLSFRKKKDHVPECSKPHQWQEDEKKVREGTCSFQVRYQDYIEVFDSRGMYICEEAAQGFEICNNVKGNIKELYLCVWRCSFRVVDEIMQEHDSGSDDRESFPSVHQTETMRKSGLEHPDRHVVRLKSKVTVPLLFSAKEKYSSQKKFRLYIAHLSSTFVSGLDYVKMSSNSKFTDTEFKWLIETIKTYPILFDKIHPEHNSFKKKNKIYEEIGLHFNESGDEIKRQWMNIMNSYKKFLKLNKITTDQAIKTSTEWQWSDEMEFLQPFVSFSETSLNVRSLTKGIQDGNSPDRPFDETQIEPASSQTYEVYVEAAPTKHDVSSNRKRKKNDCNKTPVESVVHYFENPHKKDAGDKTDLLFSSYAETLKTFTLERQAVVKLKMAELFAEHELLHLKETSSAQMIFDPSLRPNVNVTH